MAGRGQVEQDFRGRLGIPPVRLGVHTGVFPGELSVRIVARAEEYRARLRNIDRDRPLDAGLLEGLGNLGSYLRVHLELDRDVDLIVCEDC